MAVSPRLLKRRIKSIRSTRKIMKAMELVAASKMRKAAQQTVGTRPYSHLIEAMVERVRGTANPNRHPLLAGYGEKPGKSKSLLLIAASDRGLCGSFNNQITKRALEFIRNHPQDEFVAITVGRRAEQAMRRMNIPLLASFEAISNAPTFERVLPITNLIRTEFDHQRIQRVFVAYTEFKGALTQVPHVESLLPLLPGSERRPFIQAHSLDQEQEQEKDDEKETVEQNEENEELDPMRFEPSTDAVLDELLPRMVEIKIYQSLLESSASEHAARMMAMRSAGDAAKDVLDSLTLTLNQARQANITREISEIAASKAAIH